MEPAIKGPGLRIDLEVRRLWECPRCGRRARDTGDVVSKRCGCTPDGEWMRLVERRREVRTFPRPDTSSQPLDEKNEPGVPDDVQQDADPDAAETAVTVEYEDRLGVRCGRPIFAP